MCASQAPGNSAGDAAHATPRTAKAELRDRLLAARRDRPPAERAQAARSVAAHALAAPEVRRATTVAAYVGVGAEVGTAALLAGLRAAGVRVLLPLLRPDADLDWAVLTREEDLRPASRGLREPEGPPLGLEAIATADVVLVPGLAVDDAGRRLGRGGGSYDRALARVPVGTPVWVLLHDDEVGVPVPVEPHDRPVTGALTPSGLVRLPRR
ncbi:5-formyltetrahydrofolate cyclo-ligase [Nocardioides sp. TRM66260-LWL]|uniref:5-formyltetrahydrofolate cyclo-ligase n=1 Tax=Nocardioides sp. TRM66260-LWL TaxID=2874478 RepID=UPI001CC3DA3A|nr:5-formyltetrahydrofolate cyclo-ligase [Nocardioides sp. TRM66260-LWL]MBZ5735113.1 5-formyltetrahydrofolate cyclo-ligase [Nocardioides sp. TRM66260-LWL]